MRKGTFVKCSGWTVKTVEAVETKENKQIKKKKQLVQTSYRTMIMEICKFVNFMSEEAQVREPGP